MQYLFVLIRYSSQHIHKIHSLVRLLPIWSYREKPDDDWYRFSLLIIIVGKTVEIFNSSIHMCCDMLYIKWISGKKRNHLVHINNIEIWHTPLLTIWLNLHSSSHYYYFSSTFFVINLIPPFYKDKPFYTWAVSFLDCLEFRFHLVGEA